MPAGAVYAAGAVASPLGGLWHAQPARGAARPLAAAAATDGDQPHALDFATDVYSPDKVTLEANSVSAPYGPSEFELESAPSHWERETDYDRETMVSRMSDTAMTTTSLATTTTSTTTSSTSRERFLEQRLAMLEAQVAHQLPPPYEQPELLYEP
ncbi:hypothetical protein GGX14DRAFT_426923 [Mycena pura]|uniref:Uncharacterized protein n=1 Tax=Mycena pura TaxID=153505 RepID=A0AAD7E1J9_9AGAR|nr:hypothetical protein GGX14DRAFT_426923 [Mycena pura]